MDQVDGEDMRKDQGEEFDGESFLREDAKFDESLKCKTEDKAVQFLGKKLAWLGIEKAV